MTQIDEPNLDVLLEDFDVWCRCESRECQRSVNYEQSKQAIAALIATQVAKARIDELRAIEPPEQYKDYAMISGHDACAVCGFNAIKFGEFIEDRIAQLRSTPNDQL